MPPDSKLHKRALLLEYFTVAYNIGEGAAALLAGYLAASIALVGFGLDSAIESLSGAVLIWRLLKHGRIPPEEEERVEKRAVALVGWSFFALGAYVLFVSLKKLYLVEAPEPTLFGMVIAAFSIIIMPLVAYTKYRTGKKMGLKSLVADSKQTLMCSLLSVALLVGLGLNYLYGLWWADPASALAIAVIIIREGFETLKEEKLCTC